MCVRSLGREDCLEYEMATHSNISRLENVHGQRSLAEYSPQGPKKLDTVEWVSTHAHWIINVFFQTRIYKIIRSQDLATLLSLENAIVPDVPATKCWKPNSKISRAFSELCEAVERNTQSGRNFNSFFHPPVTDRMFVSPPASLFIEALTPNVTVLRGGAFVELISLEDTGMVSPWGISVLVRRGSSELYFPICTPMRGHSEKGSCLQARKRALIRTWSSGTLILDLQPPVLRRSFLWFKPPSLWNLLWRPELVRPCPFIFIHLMS